MSVVFRFTILTIVISRSQAEGIAGRWRIPLTEMPGLARFGGYGLFHLDGEALGVGVEFGGIHALD